MTTEIDLSTQAPETLFANKLFSTGANALSGLFARAYLEDRLVVMSKKQVRLNEDVSYHGGFPIVSGDVLYTLGEGFTNIPKFSIPDLNNAYSFINEISQRMQAIQKGLVTRTIYPVNISDLRTRNYRLGNSDFHFDPAQIPTHLNLFATSLSDEANIAPVRYRLSDEHLAAYGRAVLSIIIGHLGERFNNDTPDQAVLVI
ncbi:MAG: hypothetical protein WCO33_01700 [bacterium]